MTSPPSMSELTSSPSLGPAVDGGDDHVLHHVDEAAGQVARSSRS